MRSCEYSLPFIRRSCRLDPLVQNELMEVLGQFASVGMNFVSGAPLNERNRVEVMIDDQGLYRETQVRPDDAYSVPMFKMFHCVCISPGV